jgi:hypothetical protein
MKAASLRKYAALAALALVGTTQLAHAAGLFGDQDVDPRFRAKIMKEKAKQNQAIASAYGTLDGSDPSAQCGSQNIGNTNTNGRIGTAPKEVFVFAPNAINLVSGNGCK